MLLNLFNQHTQPLRQRNAAPLNPHQPQVRAAIEESRTDARPSIPSEVVFDRLEARLTAMIEAEDAGK